MIEPAQLAQISRDTYAALFCGTDYLMEEEPGKPKRRRMTPNACRVGRLIWDLSFDEGQEGVWVRTQAELAAATGMEPPEFSDGVKFLREVGLLFVERRQALDSCEAGLWYQLTPSQMVLQERAKAAAAAFFRLKLGARAARAPHLIPPQNEERRDLGLRSIGLAQADVVVACEALQSGKAGVVGGTSKGADRQEASLANCQRAIGDSPTGRGVDVGDSPTETVSALANCQRVIGESPTSAPAALYGRVGARAPVDSLIDTIRPNRNDSGAVSPVGAACGRGRRAKDAERDRVLQAIAPLCPEEWNSVNGQGEDVCRRTWIRRVMATRGDDCLPWIEEALGEVEHMKETGQKFRKSPLAVLFARAKKYAAEAGKKLT